MIKRKISKIWILPAIASGALLVGVFFPMAVFQGWKQSVEQSYSVDQQIPESKVLRLALSPVSERQTELEAIAQDRNPSLERSRARYLLASDTLAENPETAIKLLKGLEQDYPILGGHILVKRARAYEKIGDVEKAEKTWQELLTNYGDQPVVVEALYTLGKTNPEYWDQAIAKFPSHPRTIEIAETRLKQNPNQPELLFLIANHGLSLKDYGTYLEQLKAKFGNQLTPEQWEIVAFGYWEKQDYGKAAIAYSKATKTPKNLYRQARGLWLNDKIPESRIAYKQLINTFPQEIDPQGEDAGFGLLRLSRLSDQKDALVYLDAPLRSAEGTQEKARILTLLGYSQRGLGRYDRSLDFHQQALEIARNAGDKICEIANLNHLSRTYVQQQNYGEAINYSQRALIFSRQTGDKTGEANALVNLGYSEVMQAKQTEISEPEVYEFAINYLEQGLKLAEKLNDLQSQALCFSSLGIAYLVTAQYPTAINYLENAFKAAQVSGDLYLQGRDLAYLAEANYLMANYEKAVYTGSLGMYLLDQIASDEWRQPAGLLTIIRGQIGTDKFQLLLQQNRPKMIAIIGVDGYDYIPTLLVKYQEDM